MVIKNSEHFFYANDGRVLKSLNDMIDWVKTATNESYDAHINFEKNDFVGWTRLVLKDNVLAKSLEKCYNRNDVLEALEERHFSKNKSKHNKKTIISKIKEAVSND